MNHPTDSCYGTYQCPRCGPTKVCSDIYHRALGDADATELSHRPTLELRMFRVTLEVVPRIGEPFVYDLIASARNSYTLLASARRHLNQMYGSNELAFGAGSANPCF